MITLLSIIGAICAAPAIGGGIILLALWARTKLEGREP